MSIIFYLAKCVKFSQYPIPTFQLRKFLEFYYNNNVEISPTFLLFIILKSTKILVLVFLLIFTTSEIFGNNTKNRTRLNKNIKRF